jgi:hypothetical protein
LPRCAFTVISLYAEFSTDLFIQQTGNHQQKPIWKVMRERPPSANSRITHPLLYL